MIYIRGGNLVTETEIIKKGILAVDGRHIVEMGQNLHNNDNEDCINAAGCYVLPGFVDLHVHGGNGADFTDASASAISKACRYHAQRGTTGLLMTTRTMTKGKISASLKQMAAYMKQPDLLGSAPLGIHLEGPFINEKYKGAQNADLIQPPALELMKLWMEESGYNIREVTLAPEQEGAGDLITWLFNQGVLVSAGHCGPDYEQMKIAIQAGVRHVTHGFNGMRGFTHRDPGMIAAMLMDSRVTVELIMDALHVHPAAGNLLVHNKGTKGVALITDAVRPTGLPDGEYSSSESTVTVKEGAVRLSNGSLAGSTLTMNKAVVNVVNRMGLSWKQASEMASLTPARLLGLDGSKGSLKAGKDADLVVMKADGSVMLTMIEGRVVYREN